MSCCTSRPRPTVSAAAATGISTPTAAGPQTGRVVRPLTGVALTVGRNDRQGIDRHITGGNGYTLPDPLATYLGRAIFAVNVER